jgi:S-adenosylmethionine hydrolase
MGPLFTLTTDFGSASSYPAQLKAVLLAAIPDARIVDISHDVPAFDTVAAALLLEAAVPWFPRETIHVAVVDPGVGTARRGLVVTDGEARRLVGPDNGLFTPFLGRGARVRVLSEHGGVLPPPRTATFHGRDLFAPAAAYLARGGTAAALGPEVSDPVLLEWPAAVREGDEVRGVMLAADPFGNVVTSIRAGDLAGAAVLEVDVSGRKARFVRTYGEGEGGELLALVGSGGRLEIAVREGSAARLLGGWLGLNVRVVLARGAS